MHYELCIMNYFKVMVAKIEHLIEDTLTHLFLKIISVVNLLWMAIE